MDWERIASIGMAVWRDGKDICALSDDDRHLGHVVNDGKWHAFDAVHHNAEGNGFRHVGAFATVVDAKAAVERSVIERVDRKGKRAALIVRIR